MKVMEYRPIEVKLISGKKLKNVNVVSRMDVYVVGSVSGDPRSIQRTVVHKDGGVNPTWNHVMKFNMDESAARLNRLGLVFQIMSDRTLGDKEVGRVYVPLKELFHAVGDIDENTGEISCEEKHVVYQVQTASGKFKGQLEFSYKFGKKFTQSVLQLDEGGNDSAIRFEPKINDPYSLSNVKYDDEPVMAYPTGPGPSHMPEQYPGQEQRPNSTLPFEPKINEPHSMPNEKCEDEPVMAYPTGPGQYPTGPGPSTYPGQYPTGPGPSTYPGVGGAAQYNYGGPPPGYPIPGYNNQGYGNENGHGYGYGHPPPPPPNTYMGHGYPHGGEYSYPGQASTGFTQQPVQPQKKKNNKFGLGAAAGVGAGLLGGFLVGEMVEDVAEEAAFDDDMYDW